MIYLDNASTTRPIFKRSSVPFFNLNMPYANLEKDSFMKAQETIKDFLNVKSGLILCFKNATEAISWLASKMKYVYGNAYEHESVWNTFTNYRIVSTMSLSCHQLVNQITGDVDNEILPTEHHTRFGFEGSDFTAAIGHVEIPQNIENLYDAVWFSGHKFYTEKNIGIMWISDRLANELQASQDIRNQYGLIHGTVDVAGCIMVAKTLDWIKRNQNMHLQTYNRLYKELSNALSECNIEYKYICRDVKTKSKAINAIRLFGFNADSLMEYLANNHIYIGVGHSACAELDDYRVLHAFGCSSDAAKETIRVSFSFENTELDVHTLAEYIKNFKEKYL